MDAIETSLRGNSLRCDHEHEMGSENKLSSLICAPSPIGVDLVTFLGTFKWPLRD